MTIHAHSRVDYEPSVVPQSGAPLLRPLSGDDLNGLQEALSKVARPDGYSVSAGYYAMTGRNGLWSYSTDDTFMVIAAHPNSDNHLLLFPPIGKEPSSLLSHFMRRSIPFADQAQVTVQLARMASQDQLLLSWTEATGQFKSAPEELLDWKFPVHTLSTKAVVDHMGRKFRNFRHGIHQAKARGLSMSLVETDADKTSILNLTENWASTVSPESYSKEHLTAPTRATLDLMDRSDLPIHGLIIHNGTQPVGYMTWEETSHQCGIANSMCGLSTESDGAAEFIYLNLSQILFERGFDHVCIGGSETVGLDAFKRKMNPVRSVPLQSAFAVSP